MKILHIVPDLHTGGAQKLCIDTCNELAKNSNNDVCICSIEKLTKEQETMYRKIDSKVKFISINKSGKNPMFVFDLIKMIFSVKPDITHTHSRAQVFSVIGLLLYGKPNIHTIHSVADKELNRGYLRIYKFLYDFFNFTPVSISKRVLKTVHEFYGSQFNVLIDNGVKRPEKSYEFNKIKKFITSLRTDKDTKIFVSIGRFYEVKNQELLIDAFEELLKEGIDAHLLILGSTTVVPEYAQRCIDKIKTKNRIHVLGEKKNIYGYLVEADALCFSSIYEGAPMSIIEAMSIGVPTVSTSVGGIPDIVIDGKSGYLSKDMSVQSYTEALKRIVFENSIDKQKLIEYYDANYTIEKCAQQYMDLYIKKVVA